MPGEGSTNRSFPRPLSALHDLLHWFVFKGNRRAITGFVLLVVFGALVLLTGSGVLAVGPDSAASTLFSSGLTSGILTVVTLVLSINQLILSRVFGSPSGLSDRLQGTKEFRAEVERLADVPATPNDPAAFLALIGATIARRGRDIQRTLRSAEESATESDHGPSTAGADSSADERGGESTDGHVDSSETESTGNSGAGTDPGSGDGTEHASGTAPKRPSSEELGDEPMDEEIGDTLEEVIDYGDEVAESLEPEMSIAAVLDFLLATKYAGKMTDVHEVRNVYGDRLDGEANENLECIESLFGLIAISRQFFKTLALQENFARLSRIIATTGLAAFFSTVTLTLLYRTSTVTIDPGLMPLVVSIGLTIVVAPVVAVIVYVLRAATIATHTVSVGPFVPPGP